MTTTTLLTTRWHRHILVATALATLLVTTGGLSAGAAAKAPSRTFLKATVQGYTGVLTDSSHHALYVLTSEKGGHLRCKGACLTTWPPLLVKTKSIFISTGKGVKGTFSLVKRSATEKQITYNGYPVYQFSGDSGAYQANGQGIAALGGVWRLINAGAKTASKTPDSSRKTVAKSTTTTTKNYGY